MNSGSADIQRKPLAPVQNALSTGFQKNKAPKISRLKPPGAALPQSKRVYSPDSSDAAKQASVLRGPASKRQRFDKPVPAVSSTKNVSSALTIKRSISSSHSTINPLPKSKSLDRVSKCSVSSTSLPPAKATNPRRPPWDIKGKLEDMEKKYAENRQLSLGFRAELESSNQRILLLEQTKQQIESDLKVQNDQTAEASSTISQLQHQLNAKEDELQSMKRKLQAETENFSVSKSSYERQLAKLQSDLDVSLAECSGLKITIVQQSSAQAGLSAELTAIKLQLNNALHDASLKSDRISSLEKELGEMKCAKGEVEQKLRNEEGTRRQLHNTIQELKGNIRVFCRVRPVLHHEATGNVGHESDMITHMSFPDPENHTISLSKSSEISLNESTMCGRAKGLQKYDFAFDRVFEPRSTQEEVFSEISQLVQSVLDGYNVCVFAYGQTGSGKTYTMEGPVKISEENEMGMIPRAVAQIFQTIELLKSKGWEYSIEVSYLEIYNETIRDLLGSNDESAKHEIKMRNGKKNDIYVTNLTTETVEGIAKVNKLIEKARKNKAIAATKCNQHSSRSHCVFQLKLTGSNSITTESCEGTLNLVDLAGSERLKESGSEGERLVETKNINSSLSVLGNVIMSLSNKADHIPYRNSKLTHLLMNSLGGNSKTLMFVNVSPQEENVKESLNSLRFATKVNQCNIGTAQKKVK